MLDFTSGVLTDASASTTISDALDAEVIDKIKLKYGFNELNTYF